MYILNLFYLINRNLNFKNKILIIIIILFSGFKFCFAENNIEIQLSDTIKNYKSDAIKIDSLYINNQIKSDKFYDSLISRASKNKITKTALNLLLINQPKKGKFIGIEDLRNEEYYRLYEGKIIRNIEVLKLDVFGPTFKDTTKQSTNWVQQFGNNTHIKTREFIIKNNLFFNEGDSIDPAQLVDNERLLRELAYLKDASIQIAEVPEFPELVDVLIITKDVYSAGIYVDLYNSTSGTFEIYEDNLAGIGHRLIAGLEYNTLEANPIGYNFNYRIGNIGNSFIKTDIQYKNVFETEKYGIRLYRKFISYNTKWAGHIGFNKTYTQKDIKKTDTTIYDVNLNYSTQDFWIGRSFLIKTNNFQYQNRTRIVLGFRYISNSFYEGPEISERYNFQYHDNKIALASIAFAREKHYKSNLIYGFGKTEDIPIGTIIQINAGPEKDEFFKRIYSGLKFAKGIYYPKIGYLNFQTEFGGHFYNYDLEQGVLDVKMQAISNLHYVNKLKTRNFISINYTRGINRFPDEQIFLNTNDIWEFKSDYVFGIKKLSLHSEVVAFSDMYLYNFRFLFFGFGDLGLIGPEYESVFKQKLYSGIGIGLRVRNENFVFKTFQIQFAFYPSIPKDMEYIHFVLSGENYTRPINFQPGAPEIIEYQ